LRVLLVLFCVLAFAVPASAALKVCNKTTARIGVAVGAPSGDYQQASEGWFNLKPGACEHLVKGELGNGPYFIHAIDYDRGGEWGGPEMMCVSETSFQIEGRNDCFARGFMRAGFRRIDTNGQKTWSIDLSDGNRGGGGS
jgi:uncharacterized membrane protein